MKRKVIRTADGSKTIHIEEWNEQYHSIHGAINEANHVFIKHGLHFYSEQNKIDRHDPIHILEVGFGTGLNAFITQIEAHQLKTPINYTGVEAYPISYNEIEQLNYVELIDTTYKKSFDLLHQTPWHQWAEISKYFRLLKQKKFFQDIEDEHQFNLIYFDAFGARVQPDLWTESIFEKMYRALIKNGVLVTYSAKGSVRRAMEAVGFKVERLPGPPGKREMLRALKMD